MCTIYRNHSEDENIGVKGNVVYWLYLLINVSYCVGSQQQRNINDNICLFLPTLQSLYISHTIPSQSVARGQHIARDTVLCCLR